MAKPGVKQIQIHKYAPSGSSNGPDLLAVEEPLEIRLGFGPLTERTQRSIAITMRTPGHDFDLAVGFLFTEGIIQSKKQILSVKYCFDDGKVEEAENIVRVELQENVVFDTGKLNRHFYTTSSCGVCGKASIEAIESVSCFNLHQNKTTIKTSLIPKLPNILRTQQLVFEHTGGLHAAALFSNDGELIAMKEDVGRHNAVDKLIGAALYADLLPLENGILALSGRASFELIQKASMAGIPIIAAVGAPSSLAVELAASAGLTLIGFVRDGRFNVYSEFQRVVE